MKKLLLGLGSVASVIAPVAAVISCGVEVSVTETNGGNGTGTVQTTTTAVSANLATTVNASITGLGGATTLTASDITATEKVTNFVFGSMHPKTYEYAVSYTLGAMSTSLKLDNINSTAIIAAAPKAGDKLVIAAKMPSTTRRTSHSTAAMPKIFVFVVPADGVGPTDVEVTNHAGIEKLAKEILIPVFPEIGEKFGMPVEVDLGVAGTNPMN